MRALCFGRERRLSREALKNFSVSIGWMAVNWCMVPVIYMAMEFTRNVYGLLSIPTLPASTWESVPWPILLLISVLVKDFADYWNHRLMHTRWIWPIHAVHHSDTHVNFLTSYRIHFLESVFMDASYVILLTWLGVPSTMGAFGRMLFTLFNCYVHIDIDFGHGPLKYILTSPRLPISTDGTMRTIQTPTARISRPSAPSMTCYSEPITFRDAATSRWGLSRRMSRPSTSSPRSPFRSPAGCRWGRPA